MGKKLLTPSNLKSVRFELSGLDEYLKKVEAAGENVEEAVVKAIDKSTEPVYSDIRAWALNHLLSGITLEGVNETKVQRDGNFYYKEVGIDDEKSRGAWHAVFVEYGTPTQEADPGIRMAFESNKKKVRKIQKDVLTKEGIPTG
jgi:HK97 gp10 family phage protein